MTLSLTAELREREIATTDSELRSSIEPLKETQKKILAVETLQGLFYQNPQNAGSGRESWVTTGAFSASGRGRYGEGGATGCWFAGLS